MFSDIATYGGSCFMAHEAQDLSNEKSFFFRCQLSYFYVPLLHLQDDKAVLYASGHQWNDSPCQLSFLSSEEGNRHAAHHKIELDFPFKRREREKRKCLWIYFQWSADELIHHFIFVDIKKRWGKLSGRKNITTWGIGSVQEHLWLDRKWNLMHVELLLA